MTRSRRLRPSPQLVPIRPDTFVRRVAGKLGRPYGRWLVDAAFSAVEESGDPDPWIAATQAARDAGTLDHAFAQFLVYMLAERSMEAIVWRDEELIGLYAQIEAIERALGVDIDGGEYIRVGEGPAEWERLNEQWDAAFDVRLTEIFRRNGEAGFADDVDSAHHQIIEEGRLKMFGPVRPPGGDEGAAEED